MTRDEIVKEYTRRLSQTLTTVEPKEYWAVQGVLTAAILDADLEARQELNPIIRRQESSLKEYEEEAIALVRRINHEVDRRNAVLQEMIGLNQVISNLQAQAGKMADEKEEMRRSLELRALAIREARADSAAAGGCMAQALDEADDALHRAERLAAEVQAGRQVRAGLRAELKMQRTQAQEAHDERNSLIFRLNAMGGRNQEVAALKAQIDMLTSRAGLLSHERDVYYKETGKLNGVISNLQAQAGQMTNEIAALKAASTYDQQVASDIFNGQRGKIAELEALVKKLSDELAEAKSAAAYDVQGLAGQLQVAQRTIENQSVAIGNLRANYTNRLNDIKDLRDILGAADARLEESEKRAKILEGQLEESKGGVGNLESMLDFANACLRESDGRVGALVGELAACREEADELASELIEARKRHEQDLICLQESDQRNAALVASMANGVQVSENLRAMLDASNGRAEFLNTCLNDTGAQLKRAKTTIEALRALADSHAEREAQARTKHEGELEGVVTRYEGQIHGLVKEREAREAQFLKASNALTDSERAAVSLSRQLVEMTLERNTLAAKLTPGSKTFEAADRDSKRLQLQVTELLAQREELRTELNVMGAAILELTTERDDLLRKIHRADSALIAERDDLLRKLNAGDSLVRELAVERDSLKGQVARLEEAIRAETGLGVGQWHEEGRP